MTLFRYDYPGPSIRLREVSIPIFLWLNTHIVARIEPKHHSKEHLPAHASLISQPRPDICPINLSFQSSDSTVTPSSPVSQSSPQPLPSSSSIELPSTTTTEPSMYAGSASSPTSPVASPDNTVSSIGDREDTIQDLAALSRYMVD